MPATLPEVEYPGHMEIRRVASNGCISWRAPVFLTETLAGHVVGFEEVDDGLWTVYYGTVALARFDERHRQLHPIAAISTGRSPTSSAHASRATPV